MVADTGCRCCWNGVVVAIIRAFDMQLRDAHPRAPRVSVIGLTGRSHPSLTHHTEDMLSSFTGI